MESIHQNRLKLENVIAHLTRIDKALQIVLTRRANTGKTQDAIDDINELFSARIDVQAALKQLSELHPNGIERS